MLAAPFRSILASYCYVSRSQAVLLRKCTYCEWIDRDIKCQIIFRRPRSTNDKVSAFWVKLEAERMANSPKILRSR